MARQSFDCTTCDKYHPTKEDQPARGGTCRLNPPKPFVLVVGAQVTTNPMTGKQQQEPLIQSGIQYPTVGKGDYCFEHPAAKHFVMPLLAPPRSTIPPRAPEPTVQDMEDTPGVMDKPKGHS